MCMELPKLRLPNLNVQGMQTDEKLNLLADYLQALEKNIRFVLNNLEEDNLATALSEKMDDINKRLQRIERGEGNA